MSDNRQLELFPRTRREQVIIGLAGRARSGKDTVARRMASKHGYWQYSFAQPLRDGLKAMFGVKDSDFGDGRKEQPLTDNPTRHSPRYLLQTLGTEWGRHLVGADIWLEVARQRTANRPLVVISDVRFGNEAAWIKQQGGIVVWIDRHHESLPGVRAHVSETGLFEQDADYSIKNDSTISNLYREVDELMTFIGRGVGDESA